MVKEACEESEDIGLCYVGRRGRGVTVSLSEAFGGGDFGLGYLPMIILCIS